MRVRFVIALVAASSLGACAPDWYSMPSNPAACPHDSLPNGSCSVEGTTCSYQQNTGPRIYPPLYQSCACAAGSWNCTVSGMPPVPTDGGDVDP